MLICGPFSNLMAIHFLFWNLPPHILLQLDTNSLLIITVTLCTCELWPPNLWTPGCVLNWSWTQYLVWWVSLFCVSQFRSPHNSQRFPVSILASWHFLLLCICKTLHTHNCHNSLPYAHFDKVFKHICIHSDKKYKVLGKIVCLLCWIPKFEIDKGFPKLQFAWHWLIVSLSVLQHLVAFKI